MERLHSKMSTVIELKPRDTVDQQLVLSGLLCDQQVMSNGSLVRFWNSRPLRLRSAHLQVCLACSLLTLSHWIPSGYFSQGHCFSESAAMKNTVCASHSDSKLTTLMMICQFAYFSPLCTFSVLLVALNFLTAGGVLLWSVFFLLFVFFFTWPVHWVHLQYTSLLRLQSRPLCLKKIPDTLMIPRGFNNRHKSEIVQTSSPQTIQASTQIIPSKYHQVKTLNAILNLSSFTNLCVPNL